MALEPEIEAMAQLAVAGLDVGRFLRSTDQVELVTMQAVAERVREIRADEREDLARRIRHHIAEMLGG